MSNIPRPGTRARAAFDAMYNGYLTPPGTFRYSDVKSAYDNHEPAKALWQTRYSGMDVHRLLKKYATRVAHGVYKLKEDFVESLYASNKIEPKRVITVPLDLSEGSMTAVCRALLADTNADEQLQNDIVYMAKLYTKAQDNLHDAATNFAKVTIELDSLLERVKALKPKT